MGLSRAVAYVRTIAGEEANSSMSRHVEIFGERDIKHSVRDEISGITLYPRLKIILTIFSHNIQGSDSLLLSDVLH